MVGIIETYWDDHFVILTNIESLCWMVETIHIMLHVDFFFFFFNEKELEGNLEMIESRALVLQKENQIKIPVVSDI